MIALLFGPGDLLAAGLVYYALGLLFLVLCYRDHALWRNCSALEAGGLVLVMVFVTNLVWPLVASLIRLWMHIERRHDGSKMTFYGGE